MLQVLKRRGHTEIADNGELLLSRKFVMRPVAQGRFLGMLTRTPRDPFRRLQLKLQWRHPCPLV
jgi:hypothetical protein